MIRAVLDTNIIVSALLQPLGPSAHLLLLSLNGSIQICLSGSIYTEYEEVISRPRFQRSPEAVVRALDAIRKAALWVRPTETMQACSDPDDNMFLECALAARANYLVTGNLRHFPPSWGETRTVLPRWLADQLATIGQNR